MGKSSRFRISHSVTGILTTLLLQLGMSLPAFAQEVHHFEVDTTDAAKAIHLFGSQSGVQILASADVLSGKQLNKISGDLSTDEGFQRLLAGTGLSHRYVGERAVALVSEITARESKPARTSDPALTPNGREVQNPTSPVGRRPDQNDQATSGRQSTDSDSEAEKLEEVVVTGSRLRRATVEGPQQVNVYSEEDVVRSGRMTAAGFLNTLSEVSVSIAESNFQTFHSTTTVRLRGLPIGTTLVLLNGRRVQTSGVSTLAGGYVDLNSIPASAIERVEIAPQGMSAIYGADALAGVVNIILKQQFVGFDFDAQYGYSDNSDQQSFAFAAGNKWQRGSLTAVATYLDRDLLLAEDRSITADNDYRRFGGLDRRVTECRPGNVYSTTGDPLPGLTTTSSPIPSTATGQPTIADFQSAGTAPNLCSNGAFNSVLPNTERIGLLIAGELEISDRIELFVETLYSHEDSRAAFGPATGTQLLVPETNAYNPFGVPVFVDYRFDDAQSGSITKVDALRALVGMRGLFGENWEWEIATWRGEDDSDYKNPAFPFVITTFAELSAALASSDPDTALNVFSSSGLTGPEDVLSSIFIPEERTFKGVGTFANAFTRGPIAKLPAGDVQIVVGAEYEDSELSGAAEVQGITPFKYTRSTYSAFAEGRVPIAQSDNGREVLAVTVAGRYSDSDDYGTSTTPQGGLEWRPIPSLLLRAGYSEAYRAPPLFLINFPVITFPTTVVDPLRGDEAYQATLAFGGNPDLNEESGTSKELGFSWSSEGDVGVTLSGSWWEVEQDERIAFPLTSLIIENEDIFTGRVVREPSTGGVPGRITSVDVTALNFGSLQVSGVDFLAGISIATRSGTWHGNLDFVRMLTYDAALAPRTPLTDRLGRADFDAWAPKWKGKASVGWSNDAFRFDVTGRYLGEYVDYDGVRRLGDDWTLDVYGRLELGGLLEAQSSALKGSYISFGISDVLDEHPPFSSGFALLGYDLAQYDIRGRFIYMNVGTKW